MTKQNEELYERGSSFTAFSSFKKGHAMLLITAQIHSMFLAKKDFSLNFINKISKSFPRDMPYRLHLNSNTIDKVELCFNSSKSLRRRFKKQVYDKRKTELNQIQESS